MKSRLNRCKDRFVSISSTHPVWLSLFVFLFFSIVIFLFYGGSLGNPMVFDTRYMMPEESVKNWGSLPSLKLLLQSSRILVNYSLGLNYKLTGMDPFWFRFVNVWIHVLNSFLIFVFLRKLFELVIPNESQNKLHAFLGALLFAINPVALYGVVYIIQRYIIAATLFSLMSLVAYVSALRVQSDSVPSDKKNWFQILFFSKSSGLFFLSVFFYFLALLCKQHVVMLPAVMFVLTVLTRQMDRKKLIQLILPYCLFACLALYSVYSSKWLIAEVYEPFARYAVNPVNQHLFFGESWDESLAYVQSMFNQTFLFFKYVYLWIVPDVRMMALDLPQPFIIGFWHWPETFTVILFVIYPLLAFYFVLKRKHLGLLGFGLLYCWLLFWTELSTVRFHENFVLYRSYLWMSGFFSFVPLLSKLLQQKRLPTIFFIILFCIYCVSLMTALHHRLVPFKSRLTLWEDIVQKIDLTDRRIPSAYRSAGNYAGELGSAKHFDEAFKYYKISADLNPHYDKAWYGLAGVLLNKKQYAEAIDYLKRAIKENPLLQQGYYWLGICYLNLNKYDDAVSQLELATRAFATDYLDSRYQFARALLLSGRLPQAIKYYQEVLQKEPQNMAAKKELDLALKMLQEQGGKQP